MRDPSINVKHSALSEIFKSLGFDNPEKLSDKVFDKAMKYNCKRGIVISNSTKKKKIEKVESHDENIAKWFLNHLNLIRSERGHKHVRKITENSREWTVLLEVADDCVEFIQTYNLTNIIGVKQYVSYGLDFIGRNYGLNKFKYHKDKIFKKQEIKELFDSDLTPELTRDILNYYCKKCGIDLEISEHFIYCKMDIKENQANYKEWIDAQFKGLEWTKNNPEPNQLYGPGAQQRYTSNRVKVKKHWSENFSLK